MKRLITEISHQLYCRSAFNEIIEDATLQERYAIKNEDGSTEDNLRITKRNVLYMFVPIPDKIKEDEYERFLDNYLKFLNESFAALLLYNLIKIDYTFYKDGDKVTVLLKFYRPFKIWWVIRALLEVIGASLLVYFLIKLI